VDTNTERTIARKESRAIATNISLLFSTSFSPFFFIWHFTLRTHSVPVVPVRTIFLYSSWNDSFETRPGSAGRFGTRSIRDRNRAGLTKKKGRKNQVWPGELTWWPGWPGQDSVTNPLTFVFLFFFTKTTSFWIFFKELNQPTRSNPVTRPKPGTRALDRAAMGRVLKLCWKVKRVQIPNWWFRLL